MRFSPFNPVIFGNSPRDCFPHVFSTEDNIMLECFKKRTEEMPPLSLEGADGTYSLSWNSVPFGDTDVVFYLLRDLEPGHYTLRCGNMTSNAVIVTDDKDILSQTVLIQFCRNTNRDRSDIATLINHSRYFFDLRIPGGFKDEGWDFSVDNEQFETIDADIVELYARDSTAKKLTIGTSAGVPAWFGEMVNRVLSCDLVYVDGERYSRLREATPEKVSEDVDGERFVYSISLRQSQFTKPRDLKEEMLNRIALRRTPDSLRHITSAWRKI
ncbi:MAG: hypothetical protein J6J93_01955 [Muribaculaceae bacterium]|nr:hypothetical protein [Muribaculaceae bacterium]